MLATIAIVDMILKWNLCSLLLLLLIDLCVHQTEDFTGTGQTLDLLTAPEDRIDFTQFTLER